MLKIREPLHTILKPDFLNTHESFTERIAGNYMQMGQYVSDTDLLHVLTQPPEIFVVGGGAPNLMNSMNVEQTQIQKVSIINNLINRIMMSADARLSYQDTVYITNILHKLGIRDERKFMKEVRRLTEETKVRNESVDLYWNHMDEIRTMIQEYSEQTVQEQSSEIQNIHQNVLHLHEEVNRRLQTAAIYRIMQSFYSSIEGAHTVTNEEYRISEQNRLSQEILLNRLRETVRGEKLPMVYRHDNIYEGDETDVTNVTVEQINERITSAVMLSLIDNLYASTYHRLDHTVQNWISTESAYYGAAENTLFRMEENTAYLQYLYEETRHAGDTLNEYRTELDLIRSMVNIYNSKDVRFNQSFGGNLYEEDHTENMQAGDIYFEHREEVHTPADLTYVRNETGGDVIEVTQVSQAGEQVSVDQSEIRNLVQETIHQGNVQTGDTNIEHMQELHTSADITYVRNETGGDVIEVTQVSQAGDQVAVDRSEIRNLVQETIHQGNVQTGDTNIEHREEVHTPADITYVRNETGGDVTELTQVSWDGDRVAVDQSEIRNLVQETIHQGNVQTGDTNIEHREEVHTPADITYVRNETGGDVIEVTQVSQAGDQVAVDRSEIRNLVQETIHQGNVQTGDTNIEHREEVHTPADITYVRNETGGDVTELTQVSRDGDRVAVDQSEIRNLVQETIHQENVQTGDTNIEHREEVHTPADITYARNETGGDVIEVTQVSQAGDQVAVDRSEIRNLVQETIHQGNVQAGDTYFEHREEVHTPADITYISHETGGDVTEVTEEQHDEFTERVYQSYQQSIARNEQYMQNLKTILEAGKQEGSTIRPAQRTLSESRRALEHPEEFLHDYQEAENAAGEREERIRIETERLLTQEQQWAHELIREYMKMPERFYHTEMISRDNVGLLLRDIQESEHEASWENRRDTEPVAPGEVLITDQAVQAGSSAYPPSSDTTVASRYPTITGYIPAQETERYQNLLLQNLYPIFRNEWIIQDTGKDVGHLAEEVKGYMEESGQKETGTVSSELEERITESYRETDRRLEREFSTVWSRTTENITQNMEYRQDREIIRSVTDRVIERWQERKEIAAEPEIVTENRNISMIHRNTETTVDEEVLEDIRQQLTQIEETNRTTVRQTENRQTENRTMINNVTERTMEYNTEEIERMVNQNMRRQIDEISDKVYGKLERQLRNEQRRRGL